MGRPLSKPSVDDPAAIEALVGYLAEGEGMEAACAHPECPSSSSVYRKMASDAEFGGVIARARAAQQHAEAEKIVALADSATPENWQVVKLQIWARQWRAGKLAPKVYGEKQAVEHSGNVGITHTLDDIANQVYGKQE